MAVAVGINGFGRIGRLAFRAMVDQDIQVVGINDVVEPKVLAHLLKWDSVHGRYPGDVRAEKDALVVDGKRIPVSAEKDPTKLPWKERGAKIVVESTGIFTKRDAAAKHLEAGAERVIISAPADDADVTLVLGVNDEAYDPAKHRVVSNASCTTNCLGPSPRCSTSASGSRRGTLSPEKLQEIENRCIRNAISRQESIGLQAITEGEFRRDWWHIDFLEGFDGVEVMADPNTPAFQGGDEAVPGLTGTGKLRRSRAVMVEPFEFLKSVTTRTAKLTNPSPAMLHLRRRAVRNQPGRVSQAR